MESARDPFFHHLSALFTEVFFNFLLIPCEVPPYLPSVFKTTLSKENKRTPKEVAVCHSVSTHSTLLPKHLYLQMLITSSPWSVSRPLTPTLSILDSPWNSSQISCCSSVSWRSWSFGSAGLKALQQFMDGVDIDVDKLRVLHLGLGGSWVVQPAVSPALPPPGWQSRFPAMVAGKAPADSLVLRPLSPALPHPCYQGQLSLAGPVKGRARSSALMPCGPALQHPHHQGKLYYASQGRHGSHSLECCS